MTTTVLRRTFEDGVLWLTKDDAARQNGISLAMVAALEAELADLTGARAVVIDAANGGFHGSAVLVGELAASPADLGEADFAQITAIGRRLGDLLARLPLPLIGIARAGALGGGLELLLRCDFLFCLDSARFKLPEAAFGFVAAWGGTQYGGRQMRWRRAQEFLLLAETLTGRDAQDAGLVTRSFATDAALDRDVARVLARLREISPVAFRETKRALAAVWQGGLTEGLDVEAVCETAAMGSGDFVHGMAAAAAHRAFDYTSGQQVEKAGAAR